MNFNEVEKYLYSRIKDKIDIGYSAGFSLKRVKYTLKLLDNPQEKFKIIHIAGTSGKGSTASFISMILTAHGFKTGLTLSPHIQDIRERVQINNKLIEHDSFVNNFSELLKTFQQVEKSKFGSLSYFEMIICLAYYTFWKERVDYAIIETGLGGTFDATNCISNKDKVCVITKIGFDHMKILGNTLDEIANNKAGIIGPHQHVVYLSQLDTNKVFSARINSMKSTSDTINLEEMINIEDDSFDLIYKTIKINKLPIRDIPTYQIENFTLAVAVINYLSQRDTWEVSSEILVETFKNFHFSGRFEIIKSKSITYVLDGAHNEQKMHAFISSLIRKYPTKKFKFVLAFKADKDVSSMIKQIIPYAESIYLTNFCTNNQDLSHKSYPIEEIKGILQDKLFRGIVKIEPDISQLVTEFESGDILLINPVIVTGSLYLVSEFREKLLNTLPQ
jgi:dihydrofolate synthase/folylpolyglutamate synthase